jgi:hypothetical protein
MAGTIAEAGPRAKCSPDPAEDSGCVTAPTMTKLEQKKYKHIVDRATCHADAPALRAVMGYGSPEMKTWFRTSAEKCDGG